MKAVRAEHIKAGDTLVFVDTLNYTIHRSRVIEVIPEDRGANVAPFVTIRTPTAEMSLGGENKFFIESGRLERLVAERAKKCPIAHAALAVLGGDDSDRDLVFAQAFLAYAESYDRAMKSVQDLLCNRTYADDVVFAQNAFETREEAEACLERLARDIPQHDSYACVGHSPLREEPEDEQVPPYLNLNDYSFKIEYSESEHPDLGEGAGYKTPIVLATTLAEIAQSNCGSKVYVDTYYEPTRTRVGHTRFELTPDQVSVRLTYRALMSDIDRYHQARTVRKVHPRSIQPGHDLLLPQPAPARGYAPKPDVWVSVAGIWTRDDGEAMQVETSDGVRRDLACTPEQRVTIRDPRPNRSNDIGPEYDALIKKYERRSVIPQDVKVGDLFLVSPLDEMEMAGEVWAEVESVEDQGYLVAIKLKGRKKVHHEQNDKYRKCCTVLTKKENNDE